MNVSLKSWNSESKNVNACIFKEQFIFTMQHTYIWYGTRQKQVSGAGGRWIVVDTGDSDGPLQNALLSYQSEKTGDYHGEFCGDM